MARARKAKAGADPLQPALDALAAGRDWPLSRDLLRDLCDRVERLGDNEPINPRESVHDRLFGAIMARLDVLQQDRASYLELAARLRRRPDLGALLLPRLGPGVATLLTRAGLRETGWRQGLQVAGLSAVVLATLRAWRRDDSAGLDATLRALDTGLRRALTAGAWLGVGLE